MRTWITILLAALVLAGCASKTNDTANGGNNSTTTGGGMGNMTMTTPVGSDTHDFSGCAVPGGTPATPCTASKAITVPPSVTMLNVTVEWSTSTPAPAGVTQGVQVKVGSATCTLPDGPFTSAPKCTKNVAATGVTKIEYSGAGPVSAKVTVTGG